MADEGDIQVVSQMLARPREETANILGQGIVVSSSPNLRQALMRVDKALQNARTGAEPCRIAVFSDDQDERSMIAEAITDRVTKLGATVKLTNGQWGRWAREARQVDSPTRVVHVIAGVPPENKAREGFAAISGDIILVWPLTKVGAAILPEEIEEIVVAPFGERPLDKAAHVVVTMCEVLEGLNHIEEERGVDTPAISHALDAGALLSICIDPSKLVDVATARKAGRRLAHAARAHAALRPGVLLSAAEMHRVLFPQSASLPPNLRRLWVEGDTDLTLLKLTDRLLRKKYESGPRLLENIRIECIGGATQVESALRRCDRDPKLELFLFDYDADGRRGLAKVKDRGFPGALLERDAVMAACDAKWVIEDLVSVGCLDRFYLAHTHLRPAREEITHYPVAGRRLVVRGEDKGTLTTWLERNAELVDLYGIIRQLISVRRRFALREPVVNCEPPADGRSGRRPEPWWYIQAGTIG